MEIRVHDIIINVDRDLSENERLFVEAQAYFIFAVLGGGQVGLAAQVMMHANIILKEDLKRKLHS